MPVYTYTTLDDPLRAPPGGTGALGINDMGQIVGVYSNASGTHGFLLSGGTYTTLDDPSATTGITVADGINDTGQIVGSYYIGSVKHGFLEITTPNPPPPAGTTADMILRGANTSPTVAGQYEIYDIGNNAILSGNSLGQVGTDWTFAGLGGFFGNDTTDMLLRDSNTGGLEVYDIANNQITGAAFIGAVGVNWQFSGVGNFSSVPGETDLLLRNVNTGGLEVYDINNNQLTGAAFIGTVGLDWQFAGVAAANGAGTSDLVLRSASTGAFEVYDIANNQLTGAASLGAVGMDWRLGGFAVDPPTGSMGSSGSTSQLVQAMAGFGGGSAAAISNTVSLGAETSQQPLLTTPQHA